MRLAILGSSGFVGEATARAARDQGHEVTAITGPRLLSRAATPAETVDEASDATTRYAHLRDQLEGHDAVINCAGLALPDAPPSPALTGANSLLPALAAALARQAGVPRFVHVSSAAVQGRRPVLDESMEFDLRSPYATSKALGEEAVLSLNDDAFAVQVYRATSVQGHARSITQSLLRLAHAHRTPVCGRGDQPLPLSLIGNTACAIIHCATMSARGVALHPWEHMTVRRFFSLVNPEARLLPLPATALTSGGELLWQMADRSDRVAAVAKRADLLVNGQRSMSTGALASEFAPPIGDEGYAALGEAWRKSTIGVRT